MIRAGSAHDLCGGLFADYPSAVREADGIRSVQSMVLMVRDGDGDGDGVCFLVLVRDGSEAGREPCYSFVPWHADGPLVTIEPGGRCLPRPVAAAIARGTPIPRHGSLFGWLQGNMVSALIAVYADHAPEYPEPSWAVMPLAGAPRTSWPPFTSEQLLGSWFWKYYRAMRIVDLAGPIAARPGTVFWADTAATLGWDCCVVSRDIAGDAGYVLPLGCYLYYEGLHSGQAPPPVGTLLAGTGKTDLAPRLRPLARGNFDQGVHTERSWAK